MTHRCLRRSIVSDKKGKKPKILKASTTSTHPVNQCARAIDVSPNNKHVMIGQNNGEVSVYDLKTLKLVHIVNLNSHGKRQVKEQHDNWIQCLSYSPSGHAVAVGTHGSVVCILDASGDYDVKGVLKASNSFISHLDWSDDGRYLQTNDGAYELLFYSVDEDDLSHTKQITSATAMRDTHWATQTCTLTLGHAGHLRRVAERTGGRHVPRVERRRAVCEWRRSRRGQPVPLPGAEGWQGELVAVP